MTAVHGPEDDRFRNLRDRAADGRRRFRRGAHASIKFENQVPITERSLHADAGLAVQLAAQGIEIGQRRAERNLDGDGVADLIVATDDGPLPLNRADHALVVLDEKLRRSITETMAYFGRQGLLVKVISGDNPTTVAAVAREAGVPDALAVLTTEPLVMSAATTFDAARTAASAARSTSRRLTRR